MKQRTRVYYTDKQKAFMWERWKQGDSMCEIAALFDRNHTLVQSIFSSAGGIRPPPRKRSSIALTLAEREDISRGLASKQSIRSIADCLKRSPSTVSREINRNDGPRRYRAAKADKLAWERGLRPKTCKLANNRPLIKVITRKLQLFWSPQQIAGWLIL